ncbi:hypothetical protein RDABS01_009370 [Bienertia sinuspersici]
MPVSLLKRSSWSKINQQGRKKNKFRMAGCQKWKPVVVILSVYCVLAVLNILYKIILDEGTSRLVIITYRLTAAAIFLMPIAYCERRRSVNVKLTAPVLCSLFVSALFGATLTQYLFLFGMQCTSAAFASSFINMVPVLTFFIALLVRQESVNLRNIAKIAKVVGSLICIGGVVLLILYRGIPLNKAPYSVPSSNNANNNLNFIVKLSSTQRWILGSISLVCAMLCWSGWFLIQSKIGKRYPCKYTSTAMMSAFGALQSAVLCFAIDKNMSIWILHGKLQIFTVISGGVLGSGLCYVGISWCVEQRGPVFSSAFSPSIQIFVAIMDLAFFHEQMFLGSVLGSILIISGLYILLWGKRREESQNDFTKSAEAVPCNGSSAPAIEIIHVSNSGRPS